MKTKSKILIKKKYPFTEYVFESGRDQ